MLKTTIRVTTYANAYLAPKNFVNINFILSCLKPNL
jgi:hypothetical protein